MSDIKISGSVVTGLCNGVRISAECLLDLTLHAPGNVSGIPCLQFVVWEHDQKTSSKINVDLQFLW